MTLPSQDISEESFQSDQYKLITKVGEGGFGRVYKAIDLKTDQILAIKILNLSTESNPEKQARLRLRFQREIQLCSQLNHPNIIKLLDHGETSTGQFFAAFEYVDGVPLSKYIRVEGKLSVESTINIMMQVLDALNHAHKKGIVHRDIKPANIMLCRQGLAHQVKVLDFGIGTLTQEFRQQSFETITITQESLGTPSYSAPEQLRGEPPTAKTDLYVWALVFIECLTGEPAISGSSVAAIFQQQLSKSSVPIPPFLANHPLGTLLNKALNKNLVDRIEDSKWLFEQLEKTHVADIVVPQAVPDRDPDEQSTLVVSPTTLGAERKFITVLAICIHCEFDAESQDLEVINTLQRDQINIAIDCAARFGAMHVGTLGDTLLFYFGFPQANDNAARLAARTALQINSQISQRNRYEACPSLEFSLHAGLHSGVVTAYGTDAPEGYTANYALWLARNANKQQILCSRDIEAKLSDYIEFSDHPIGKERGTFEILGERVEEAIGFLRTSQRNDHFVGRSNSLKDLRMEHGLASYFLLEGEAGIGKSRTILEFTNQQKWPYLVQQCLPENQYTGLQPILALLRSHLGVSTDEDTSQLIQALLEGAQGIEKHHSIPVMLTWMGLGIPEGYTPPIMPANDMKQVLFQTLAYLFSITKNDENLIYVVEDLHWADSITLEFFNLLPTLKFTSQWIVSSRKTTSEELTNWKKVQLGAFEKDDTKKLVINIFQPDVPSEDLIELVFERCNGNPLFVEEFCQQLKDKDLLATINGKLNLVSDSSQLNIPSSLQDLLQYKLDSLSRGKETAQLASTIGKAFDLAVLSSASPLSIDQIQADINELSSADLIFVQRMVQGDTYYFKHALIKEAAYHSMPPEIKCTQHLAVARAIEDQEALDREELLAHHYFVGEDFVSAVKYSKLSAQRAMSKSAYLQAIHFGDQSIKSFSHISASAEEELETLQTLSVAHMLTSGWASASVEAIQKRTRELLPALKTESKELKFGTHWSLATFNDVRGNHRQTHFEIENALELTSGDEGKEAALIALRGHTRWMQGQVQAAINDCRRALDLYDDSKHQNHAAVFGHDTKVFALSVLAILQAFLGKESESEHLCQLAIEHSESLHSLHSVCMAKSYLCACYWVLKNRQGVLDTAKDVLDICEREHLSNWVGVTNIQVAWATDDTSTADQAVSMLKAIGATQLQGIFNSIVAETMIRNHDANAALKRVEDGIVQSKEVGDYMFLPELFRLKHLAMKELNLPGAEESLSEVEHWNHQLGLVL